MRQYRISITELAEADLENAGDYIACQLKNPSAAERTIRGIRTRINSLGNTIFIVRILHMLVDSKAWLYRTFGL